MCGIIGYVGSKEVVPIIVDSLKKLEYRGYDSAGIAIVEEGRINRRRVKVGLEPIGLAGVEPEQPADLPSYDPLIGGYQS